MSCFVVGRLIIKLLFIKNNILIIVAMLIYNNINVEFVQICVKIECLCKSMDLGN